MADERQGNVSPGATAFESTGMSAVEDNPKDVNKTKDVTKKKKKGVLCRMWNGLFGGRKDDYEGRLERISKDEATVLTRMRRRAQSWGKMKRHLILFSVLLEVFAVGYAIIAARTAENWQIRAFRVLPMFLLPALSSVIYSAISSFVNMRERKDQKTLEKLRSERQEKIDELKEKTNFYLTQQLIQRYDTDPAAKAAAAAVLASKLGADSGFKVFLDDGSNKLNVPAGRSNDVELVPSNGLRNRKQPQNRGISPGGTMQHVTPEASPHAGSDYVEHNQPLYVDHYQTQGSSSAYNTGWLSRIAALIVGEDPTQCYALICGNCHMHNGLATKEDFPYVTYICPHCGAVNGPKIQNNNATGNNSVTNEDPIYLEDHGNESSVAGDSPRDDLGEVDDKSEMAVEEDDKTGISGVSNEG